MRLNRLHLILLALILTLIHISVIKMKHRMMLTLTLMPMKNDNGPLELPMIRATEPVPDVLLQAQIC